MGQAAHSSCTFSTEPCPILAACSIVGRVARHTFASAPAAIVEQAELTCICCTRVAGRVRAARALLWQPSPRAGATALWIATLTAAVAPAAIRPLRHRRRRARTAIRVRGACQRRGLDSWVCNQRRRRRGSGGWRHVCVVRWRCALWAVTWTAS